MHYVSPDTLRQIIRTTRTIAVLGAHPNPTRPACFVPDDLVQGGFKVQGVNPAFVGETRHGAPYVAQLTDLPAAPDMVLIFRRAEALEAHQPQIAQLRPRVVWLQEGIVHPSFAAALREDGLQVIENRCLMTVRHALVDRDYVQDG